LVVPPILFPPGATIATTSTRHPLFGAFVPRENIIGKPLIIYWSSIRHGPPCHPTMASDHIVTLPNIFVQYERGMHSQTDPWLLFPKLRLLLSAEQPESRLHFGVGVTILICGFALLRCCRLLCAHGRWRTPPDWRPSHRRQTGLFPSDAFTHTCSPTPSRSAGRLCVQVPALHFAKNYVSA